MGLRTAVRSLLTNGYHKRIDRKSGVVLRMDGYIAALLAGVFMTSLFVSLSSIRFFVRDVDKAVKPFVVKLALSVFFGFGIVVLFVLNCRRVCLANLKRPVVRGVSNTAQTLIPLFGLAGFLVGILILEVWNSMAYISCFYDGHTGYEVVPAVTGLAYHALKCVFVTFLFLFICLYSHTPFRSSCLIRYFLCLIVASALFLYFDFETFVSSPALSYEYCSEPRQQLSPTQQCNCRKTEMFEFAHDKENLMQPIYVEFFILAAERVLHMFAIMNTDTEEVDTGRWWTFVFCFTFL